MFDWRKFKNGIALDGFSPSEPRDQAGKWTGGGTAAGGGSEVAGMSDTERRNLGRSKDSSSSEKDAYQEGKNRGLKNGKVLKEYENSGHPSGSREHQAFKNGFRSGANAGKNAHLDGWK